MPDAGSLERLKKNVAGLRAAYLDLMRDSLIGKLNEDPPLPASKVDGYKCDHRDFGWDWPSQAPSMIGAKRMNNVRSECERVLATGVPGDFMETDRPAANGFPRVEEGRRTGCGRTDMADLRSRP